MLDTKKLRIALAAAGLRQVDAAARMGVRPTTLSSWVLGRHRGPGDLTARLETVLGLQLGDLEADTVM